MNRKFLVTGALSVALLLTSAVRSTMAALQMQLSTGSSNVTVVDNGVGDTDPAVGEISYSGSVGNFATVITAGTSNSPGANGLAVLQTHTISVRDTGSTSAALSIKFSDTGFTNPTGSNLTLGSSFAGTFLSGNNGENVSFQSYADPADAAFGTGVTSGLHTATLANGSHTPVGFSTADRTATFNATSAYSLSDTTTINLSAGGQANVSGTTSVSSPGGAVPEPASLAIMALGGLGLLRARRRTA